MRDPRFYYNDESALRTAATAEDLAYELFTVFREDPMWIEDRVEEAQEHSEPLPAVIRRNISELLLSDTGGRCRVVKLNHPFEDVISLAVETALAQVPWTTLADDLLESLEEE